jgi:hypothetical protein
MNPNTLPDNTLEEMDRTNAAMGGGAVSGEDPNGIDSRQQSMAEKGLECYRERAHEMSRKLVNRGRNLDNLLDASLQLSEKDLQTLSQRVADDYIRYETLSSDLFLVIYNTEDSAREQADMMHVKAMYAKHVQQFHKYINLLCVKPSVQAKSNSYKSAKSTSSRSSGRSSILSGPSCILGQQRAKREAARVKLMFAEQGAMLKAKMDVLSVQSEAAVADVSWTKGGTWYFG